MAHTSRPGFRRAARKCCSWERRRRSRREIRFAGGIPVVFPQFANTEWQLAENADASDDPSSVKLVLTDDHRTRELWPYHFRTELIATIDEKSLQVKLEVFNTGDEVFSFTSALHTYIAVADIREAAVRGFTGKWYLDKTQG